MVLLQDMGGKAEFEALLIYATPLAPDRTRVVRGPGCLEENVKGCAACLIRVSGSLPHME